MLFSKNHVLITVAPNHVMALDLKTGKKITQSASSPFSNERMILAEFLPFEEHLSQILNQLFVTHFFNPQMTMIIQLNADKTYHLSSVEKRAFRDAAEFVGARNMYFNLKNIPITSLIDFENHQHQLER